MLAPPGTIFTSVIVAARAVVVAGALSLLCKESVAADIWLADYDAERKQGYVYIHGSIEAGDADRFVAISIQLRQQHPGAHIAVVSLISPGGKVLEASRIAGFILGEHAITMVAPGNTCASACVMLLAAGKRKLVADTANIEVHSAAMPGGRENDASLAMTTEMARVLAELGVPADVIGRAVTTRPDQMYRLTVDDLTRMGANVIPTRPAPERAWQPAPGARPFYACAIANCTDEEKRCTASRGMDPTSCRTPEEPQSEQPALNSTIEAYLDAAPDLTDRWRQINVDPVFLAWLDQVEPFAGQKRAVLLRNAYAAGDAVRAAAFFRAYIAEHSTTGTSNTYTYVPTEQDRAEVRGSCVRLSQECLTPTINRIMLQMTTETTGLAWPTHPSQVTVMLRSAWITCGLPDDPRATFTPQMQPCLDAERNKIGAAIVSALVQSLPH